MGRIVKEIKRSNKPSKVLKNVCLIVAEGSNQTEIVYFSNYKSRNSQFNLKLEPAYFTDAYNLVKRAEVICKNNDISPKKGDIVFCLIDTDNDENKKDKILKAIEYAKKRNFKCILSSPCFEIWFLNHFEKTTKNFNNKELLKRLELYIPDYTKEKNIWDYICNKQEVALKNTEYQKKYQESLGKTPDTFGGNPSTMIPEVVNFLNDNCKGK